MISCFSNAKCKVTSSQVTDRIASIVPAPTLGGSDSCAHFAFCICFHFQLDFFSYFVKSFFLYFLFSSLYFPMLSEREPLERCQMEVDSWNVTLGRWYQPHTTFSHWTLHNSYWGGTITFEEVPLLSLLLLEMYTLYHVLHSSTLHSINLSLTIILKRHTITPFHTEHFTIHVIEKYQRHICAATSFHAEFFTTVSEEQVLLEWILKPPPYAIFFHTQLFITHIGLKKNHTRVQTLGLECTTPKIPNQHNTTPKIPNQPQPAFQRENYWRWYLKFSCQGAEIDLEEVIICSSLLDISCCPSTKYIKWYIRF